LEDYTKFELKAKAQLIPLLEGRDNLFVIACNKCFKEFEAGDEPERSEFTGFVIGQGKTLSGSVSVDFLCNKTLTDKLLKTALPQQAENIFVISCGLGVQTVAELSGLPVYAACDSVSLGGRHAMALTKRLCEACGQCYLNFTGGICPITDCSKSLLNGQCGGSENGKCEVDRDKDCAWSNIHIRLSSQQRAGGALRSSVQLRDYSKVNFKLISSHVKSIREKRFDGFYGGLHLSDRKHLSEHLPLERFPAPHTVIIPLSQHIGACATPLVVTGESVKAGQKIGNASGRISSAIHSSVSGIVTAVEPRQHPVTNQEILAVVIDSDGKNELHETVVPCENWRNLSVDDIIGLIREKGVVGMGGAAFPTSVKLNPQNPIDTVIINGCECEPLLTADHRVMLEYANDIILGVQILLKTTGAKKGIIAVEANRQNAIDMLKSKNADAPEIDVFAAKVKYPQGAEKMLIKNILGRSVPSGGLPLDVGVVVSNVSTVKAVADAVTKGLPLIERVVTVTGENVKHPGNYIVKIGTSVKDILDYCGGVADDAVIKLGGPMMGLTPCNLNVPVIKGTNGIIAVAPDISEPSPCIRCGRCVDACPMELLPLYYPQYASKANWESMKVKDIKDCIECGCCDYICPSKIAIREAIKLGKENLR